MCTLVKEAHPSTLICSGALFQQGQVKSDAMLLVRKMRANVFEISFSMCRGKLYLPGALLILDGTLYSNQMDLNKREFQDDFHCFNASPANVLTGGYVIQVC